MKNPSKNSIIEEGKTFKEIANEIISLQEKKNEDYGNAFGKSCEKWGLVSALTRLGDKMNRLESLYKKGGEGKVNESMEDTLKDLASYAIMTIEWMRNQ